MVSAATGTERVLAPRMEVEVVLVAVNEQCPGLIPTLYPGVLATVSRPFGTLDAMWLAFQTLANNETPAIDGEKYFYLPASWTGGRSFTPSGPRPASSGRGQGSTPSRSPSSQTGSRNNALVKKINKPIPDSLGRWPDMSPNCWPLDKHY